MGSNAKCEALEVFYDWWLYQYVHCSTRYPSYSIRGLAIARYHYHHADDDMVPLERHSYTLLSVVGGMKFMPKSTNPYRKYTKPTTLITWSFSQCTMVPRTGDIGIHGVESLSNCRVQYSHPRDTPHTLGLTPVI